MENLSVSPLLVNLLALLADTSMEKLDDDKHSSLLRTFVNYDRKKFDKIETGNDDVRFETLKVAKIWCHLWEAAPGIREGHARY